MDQENEVKLVFLINLEVWPDGIRAETPWGEKLDDDANSGSYRVLNDGGTVPFMFGDIVSAEIAGDSRLQVTGIESIVSGTWTELEPPAGTTNEEKQRIVEPLAQLGADWTSGQGMSVTVCWPKERGIEEIWELYEELLPQGWEVIGILDGEERLFVLNEVIDFELDMVDPFADDSRWSLGALWARLRNKSTRSSGQV